MIVVVVSTPHVWIIVEIDSWNSELLFTVVDYGKHSHTDSYGNHYPLQISHLKHIVGDTLEMDTIEEHPTEKGAYVEMRGWNQRYRTTIQFYNHRQKRYIDKTTLPLL